jgi:hypothetical protein
MRCSEEHCITCSDEGTVMTVLRTSGDSAPCRDGDGDEVEVDTSLVEAGPGDKVLVHARVALAVGV